MRPPMVVGSGMGMGTGETRRNHHIVLCEHKRAVFQSGIPKQHEKAIITSSHSNSQERRQELGNLRFHAS